MCTLNIIQIWEQMKFLIKMKTHTQDPLEMNQGGINTKETRGHKRPRKLHSYETSALKL